MSSFWNSCLSQFEQELSSQQFNTWIRPLRLEGEESPDQGLRLLAPNGFILKWVKERYLGRIEELGSAYFSIPINISLVVGSRKEEAADRPVRHNTPVSTTSLSRGIVTSMFFRLFSLAPTTRRRFVACGLRRTAGTSMLRRPAM